jgi:hypothetical protein
VGPRVYLPDAAMSEFDAVKRPKHYNSHPSGVECLTIKRCMASNAGDAFKYVFRTEHKNGRQDIEKAQVYLEDAIKHNLPIWIPDQIATGQYYLNRVINDEPNDLNRKFFIAIYYNGLKSALDAVIQMLAESDCT